jgi:3-oxo-5-alpha-steroid 4-dehydrogenase 1
MDFSTFSYIAIAWIILALITFIYLLFVVAPFGRHTRSGWGPMINNTLGWVVMESVSVITFLYFFLSGSLEKTTTMWIIAAFWSAHYINRSFIYPFRQKDQKKKMPLIIMLSAIFFNFMNGFLNGYYIGNFGIEYSNAWILSLPFIAGALLFFTGMFINYKADAILLSLRKPGEKGYKIPHGFLFKYISCPNHFGEIIEWTGFALLSFNIASLSFAIWTFANLAPRAIAHHKWYKKNFSDYPKNRKAVIPMIL